MTHLTLTITNYLLNPISELVYSLIKKISRANEIRAQYMIARSTFNELHKLSDNELRDMGIARGDIYDIAYNKSEVGRYRLN